MRLEFPPFRDARFTWIGADNQWHNALTRASREERAWLQEHANDLGAVWIETPGDPQGWDGRLIIEGGPFAEPGPFDPDAPAIGWYRVKLGEDPRDRDHATIDKAARGR